MSQRNIAATALAVALVGCAGQAEQTVRGDYDRHARARAESERAARSTDFDGSVDGYVVYALAKPDRNGRTELVLSPTDLLDRLAELIVPPRRHRNRYWGAFAPHSHLRPFVVLTAGADNAVSADGTKVETPLTLQPGTMMPDDPHQPAASKRSLSSLWAVMLAKMHEVLPIVCRHCGAEMKPVAVIVDPDALTRICKHLGQPQGIPTLAPARGPPQADFDFGA